MNAVIVAAGMGSRLKNYTVSKPKCMLKIDDIPLFERQTKLLLENGIDTINVVVGYKKECFFENGYTDEHFRYFVNSDYENNNILHSLFYAEDVLKDEFFFTYCDIIYDDIIVKQMLNRNEDIVIAVDANWHGYYEDREDHPVAEAELVFSNDGKTVSKIHKNAEPENAVGEFLGVAYFSKKGAELLKEVFYDLKKVYANNSTKPFKSAKNFKQAYMTDMFQELTDRGYPVYIEFIKGSWAEVDIPRDLKAANELWKNKKD